MAGDEISEDTYMRPPCYISVHREAAMTGEDLLQQLLKMTPEERSFQVLAQVPEAEYSSYYTPILTVKVCGMRNLNPPGSNSWSDAIPHTTGIPKICLATEL